MKTFNDPHELDRLAPFAKDEGMEAFLLSLNQRLQTADIFTPAPIVQANELPIVYIVGVPRSGTTLLSQLVSKYLGVGYINNLIARFWLRPSVGVALSNSLLGREGDQQVSMDSRHGTTAGVSNPSEFGYFWRYWLNLDVSPTHHLSSDLLQALDHQGLKNVLEDEILAPFSRPAVFKNVICGFHAKYLSNLHEKSLFVYVQRNLIETSSSILKVRKERLGDYRSWWSLKPSAYLACQKDDPVEEVAMQALACRREMEKEVFQSGVRAIGFRYEEICANPKSVLETIRSQLSNMGAAVALEDGVPQELKNTGASELPSGFVERLYEFLPDDRSMEYVPLSQIGLE